MGNLGAGCQLDERGQGGAIATPRRQLRNRNAAYSAVVAYHDAMVGHAAFVLRQYGVAILECNGRGIDAMALARAYPETLRDEHRHRLIVYRHAQLGDLGFL